MQREQIFALFLRLNLYDVHSWRLAPCSIHGNEPIPSCLGCRGWQETGVFGFSVISRQHCKYVSLKKEKQKAFEAVLRELSD